MPETRPDRRVHRLLLGLALFASLSAPAPALARDPPDLERFMWAVAQFESGGRYDARNERSGAFGKYQFMPASWSEWARRYLGNARAAPTHANQEAVARAKFVDLYEWLGSWPPVAFWWLTGTVLDPHDQPTAHARRYVAGVMALFRLGPTAQSSTAAPAGHAATLGEDASAVSYEGNWPRAAYPGYLRGTVRYSVDAGASVTLTFTGRSVSWLGPVGPTRGRARVLVDGTVARIVDLRAAAFRARAVLFSRRWESAGRHTVTIEVLTTPGRPVVAVDAFVVS